MNGYASEYYLLGLARRESSRLEEPSLSRDSDKREPRWGRSAKPTRKGVKRKPLGGVFARGICEVGNGTHEPSAGAVLIARERSEPSLATEFKHD